MRTITLKTDDAFFDHVTLFARNLNLTKSELIRRSIKEYENFIKNQALKEQVKKASFRVRNYNYKFATELENTLCDGLENV